jgi:hypothetical protein
MTFIVNVIEWQEDFLLKLLKSLNIVTSVEQIEDVTLTVSEENSAVIKERLEKYAAGDVQTKTWEELQKEISKKYGL